MKKNIFLRAFGITTIKNLLFIILMIVGLFVFGDKVSTAFFTAIFYAVYFLNTFLFSEWMFTGVRIPALPLGVIVIGTYLWDALVSISVFSWLVQRNIFASQELLGNLVVFAIHAAAMLAAYTIRKRLHASSGMTEGLV